MSTPLFFRSFQGWPPTGQKKKTLQLQALTMEYTMKLDFRGYSWTNPRPQKSRPSYLLHIRAHWSHFRRTANDQGHSTKWPIFKPWRLHSEGLCQEKRARVGHCHWIPGSQSRQTVDASARRWGSICDGCDSNSKSIQCGAQQDQSQTGF